MLIELISESVQGNIEKQLLQGSILLKYQIEELLITMVIEPYSKQPNKYILMREDEQKLHH